MYIRVCFLLLFSVIFTFYNTYAQSPDYLPQGLHKMSDEELAHADLALIGLPLYMEGKRVSYKFGPKLKADPAYTLDYYADDNGEIKAVVIRTSSEEERALKEDPNFGPPDPAGWTHALPPEFKTEDIDGNEVDLVALEGKVVVLNFWFISCKPCVKEIPELNELVEKYKDEDVVFLALALNTASALKNFMEVKPYHYTQLPRSMPIVKDYGVTFFPTHYVIDKEGLVRLYRSGYGPATVGQIDRAIAKWLQD